MGSFSKSTAGPHIVHGGHGLNGAQEEPLALSHYGRPIQSKSSEISIIDIRQNGIDHSILDDMLVQLQPPEGQEKKMPVLLLYDAAGLKIFEDITYLDEYYLTNAEISVLETHAGRIAERIQAGSMVIELGSGNLRKVNILLQALDRIGKPFEYYALDLSLPELQRTLSAIPTGTYKNVKCYGLYGTYDDGLEWLRNAENVLKPKCILSLGSSIGNFTRDEAVTFIKGFAQNVLRPGKGDLMLIGVDACKDPEKVWRAYNDPKGVTEKFILNGLVHANHLLGEDVFHIDEWRYLGEYNKKEGRHEAFVSPVRDFSFRDVTIKAGQRVRIEESYKYSITESTRLWEASGLLEGARWGSSTGDYHLHMLSRPAFFFPLQVEQYAAKPMPSMLDWENVWATWDAVTLGMLPRNELLSKPIKLRNACIFYLGHIPAFLDMHITRATGGKPAGPSYFWKIFERGIDPDVDNPENCHAHSEIPESWPPVEEILTFQDAVRNKVRNQIGAETVVSSQMLARAFWIGFEHEIMHLETLLYMLLQSDKTLPPPGVVRPDFDAMARQADLAAVSNEWFRVPTQKITIGLDDPEDDSGPERYFGWDNEKPQRSAIVPSFEAKARPITNEEYARYLEATNKKSLPASWTSDGSANGIPHVDGDTNGNLGKLSPPNGYGNGALTSTEALFKGRYVRTVFGRVPLSQALHWPVIASYDEIAGCVRWMNGRIPTVDEVRSIYAYVDQTKAEDAEQVLSKTISAVNGHLSNNGVEETPPPHHSSNIPSNIESTPNPRQHFVDLQGCNVGFKHWHPTPVTQNGNKLSGQGDFGGAWEWTSSMLEEHKGFSPMSLYPAYTADFFDGKHNVVLGGSWATHPRIAGKKSFVNWYQRNYPYVWASARVVRDI